MDIVGFSKSLINEQSEMLRQLVPGRQGHCPGQGSGGSREVDTNSNRRRNGFGILYHARRAPSLRNRNQSGVKIPPQDSGSYGN